MELLEITNVNLGYLCLSGFIVLFSMFSLLMKERLYIGEVVFGTIFGIAIGPYGANAFNPRGWSDDSNALTMEVMRIVIAIGVFGIGVELPKAYLWDHVRSLVLLTVPAMIWGWFVSAGIIILLFPGLSYLSALVISATLTPTDPVLATAIIDGNFARKHIPAHLRRILSAESAANDGLAYPFLSIALFLSLERSTGVAVGKIFYLGILYQVVLGIAVGAFIGLAFSRIMQFSQRKGLIDRESFVAQYIALALLSVGVCTTLGSDDLLASFAAGSAISWDGHFNEQTHEAVFSSIADLLLNCATFIYIGAWIPFSAFVTTPYLPIELWRLFVLLLALLALRRLPPLILIHRWIPDVHSLKEALFCAHFGPMGVGAIFISTLAMSKLPEPSNPPQTQLDLLSLCIQPIVAFIVLGSILIHGLSVPLFMMGKRVQSVSMSFSTLNRDKPEWLNMTRPGRPSNVNVSVFAQADVVERGPSLRQRTPMLSPSNSGTHTPQEFHADIMFTGDQLSTRPADHRLVTFNLEGDDSRRSTATPPPVASVGAPKGKVVRGDTTPGSFHRSARTSEDSPTNETPSPKEAHVEIRVHSLSPPIMEVASHQRNVEYPTGDSP